MAFAMRVFPIALLLVLMACGTAGTVQQEPHRITQEEIQSSSTLYSDTYTLVQQHRPNWLHERGPRHDIKVYVDDSPYGGLGALRQVHPENVASLQFLPAERATLRYGGGHLDGVILIRTKDGSER